MSTPTPIATFEDILAGMENNPSLRAAMRQHVLDQEFLQLPAIVRELQQTVARLAQLGEDYMAATNERLEAGQASLETGQAKLEGNMNRMIGSDHERRAARRASRLAQRQMDMASMRVIYAITLPDNNRLPEMLDLACDAGRIDSAEADELENADIVLEGEGQFILAEISVTLDENDIHRARSRADLLAQATLSTVRAAAIGTYALEPARQHAVDNDVAILILPD
jgi:hypothetical protein